MKRTLLVTLLVFLPFVLRAQGPKQLSSEQAELLARAAAEGEGLTKLDGFSLEPAQMKEFPDFHFFDAVVGVPGAQGFSGHYAVDKFTAEIWDPFKCGCFSGKQLRKLQQKIKTELGLKPAEYHHHARSKPCLV